MGTLERAILIAAQAHEGQKDKSGAPYILHPLRMMMRMESEAAMIAAVLHDVVEDSLEQRGRICLQIHGGPPSEAWYKDISIEPLQNKK